MAVSVTTNACTAPTIVLVVFSCLASARNERLGAVPDKLTSAQTESAWDGFSHQQVREPIFAKI